MKQMDEKKQNELKRVCSVADSLFYCCDELMGKMEVPNENGFDVLPEDEEAFIAVGELHEVMDEYRSKLKDIINKLNR